MYKGFHNPCLENRLRFNDLEVMGARRKDYKNLYRAYLPYQVLKSLFTNFSKKET